ncbi:MAG TPA: universal stress protein [Actinomycetes bacterium]|nr:universal stress protein [Actinomycetes bacterium]
MLEKLLLAVDESEHSRKAVPATVELARAGGGSVHVLHVLELYYPVPPTVQGDTAEEAQALVDGIVEELKGAGVTAEGAVRPSTGGSPAGAILEHARELGASLIVVGSHGHSALGGLLIGSVANKLTQLSACPVLVVRDKEVLEERHHDVLRAQTRFQS